MFFVINKAEMFGSIGIVFLISGKILQGWSGSNGAAGCEEKGEENDDRQFCFLRLSHRSFQGLAILVLIR